MQDTNIDFMGPNGGSGALASEMSSGRFDVGRKRPYIGSDGKAYVTVYTGGNPKSKNSWKSLQVNAGTLRRDEWKQIDDVLLGIRDNRLDGTSFLLNRGLVFNLGNAMGTTVLEYHTEGDALTAELSMDAVTRTTNDRQEFDSVYLPIPIVHVDWDINERVLESSRRLGNPLDTTSTERAARRVMEKQEEMLFTDTKYKFGGGQIYSFLNFPHRDTSIEISDWADPAVTGEDIVQEVLEMKQASIANRHYGPFAVFIPNKYETKLDEDYSSAKGDKTIRQRILDIANIENIVVVDTLPADNVVLVQLTNDVVRIVQGIALQNIQWMSQGGFVNKFKTMSIQVPQLRADQEGRTGIVHAKTP